ncbi:unnamed protein product, partial [Brassica napus]
IWRERNQRKHGEEPMTPGQVIKMVDKNVRNRLSSIRDRAHTGGLSLWRFIVSAANVPLALNHATAARADPETESSSEEALPVGAEASGPSLVFSSSADDDGDMSGVGAGGDEVEAGDLVDEDLGGFAPPEAGEALGVVVGFFLAVVGAEAVGGEVGADAVDFGEPVAAGEGEVELLSPLDISAPASGGGSAANTAVTANKATARDNSLKSLNYQIEEKKKMEQLSNGSITDNIFPSAPAPLKQPFVIGVAGGTASGKTTVCDMIMSQLHDQRVVLVNQDSFYHSLSAEKLKKVHEYNFDHPGITSKSNRLFFFVCFIHVLTCNYVYVDAFNTEVLLSCMEKLRSGQPVSIPSYDFKTHQSIESASPVNPADVIILEGILVLNDPQVRDLMNMKIFVDTDADVRLSRRIQRDTVQRGRNIQNVLEQYTKFVKPSFDEFIQPSMKYADIIIPRGGDNDVAIDLIVQHIRTKLCQHNLCKIYSNIFIISSTFQIKGMHTLIRDVNTTKHDFVFYADRLIRLVVEHGLGHLPFTEKQITTPTGSVYTGVDFCKRLCGVSVIRRYLLHYFTVSFLFEAVSLLSFMFMVFYSGESMENALRACCNGIKIGKILIHRENNDGRQVCFSSLRIRFLTHLSSNDLSDFSVQLIYEKLPKDIASRHVFLLDPVLASGNSAVKAISLLISKGVPESHIIFLNLIAAPQGIHALCKKHPMVKIVTSEIDASLNEDSRVIPGLGEFADRYFGTDNSKNFQAGLKISK